MMAPSRWPRRGRRRLALAVAVLLSAAHGSAWAQPAPSPTPPLNKLSIEELLEVNVALPSRREDRIFDAPTAISILTAEDIRRSGSVSLPGTLRFVPGLFAARTSPATWVVTARGFAMSTPNKMLVMVDGRTVFSPLFSGVFWDSQDVLLLDLDRIEVVRGPGASLWGSNAVNGVINVVSRRASETQGTLVTTGGGEEERFFGAVRHGGRVGDGYFRVYGKFASRDDGRVNGGPALDGQRSGLAGFRVDRGPAGNALTIQGEVGVSRIGTGVGDDVDIEGGGAHVLGHWTRRFSSRAELRLQTYYDRTTRLVPRQFEEVRHTVDVDAQHRLSLTPRQTLTVGGGYRVSADDTAPTPLLFFEPEDRTTDLTSFFAQHEFRATPQFTAILGARLEDNDYTGREFQPTVRARWAWSPSAMIWGAVSRAVRLPTRLESDIRVTQGEVVTITGDPRFRSEKLVAYEAGYRRTMGGRFSFDAAMFHNRYGDLRTQESEPGGPVRLANRLAARSSGVEFTGTVHPAPWSRLTAAYAYLDTALRLDPESRDRTRGRNEAVDPAHQVWLQGRLDLPRRVELDVSVRHVSALSVPGTPAYTEAGARAGWRPTPQVELAIVARDLLHDHHLEFVGPTATRAVALERSVFTRVTLRF